MDDQRIVAEHECHRLCTAFHINVDAYRHDRVLSLFTADAVWHHKSGLLKGRSDIAAYLDSKSSYPVVRHLVTNVLIDVVDDDHAKGIAYVTVFYAEPTLSPPMLQAPIVLVTYHDTFTRTPDGWRFSSRRPEITMQSEAFGSMINTKADEQRLRKFNA